MILWFWEDYMYVLVFFLCVTIYKICDAVWPWLYSKYLKRYASAITLTLGFGKTSHSHTVLLADSPFSISWYISRQCPNLFVPNWQHDHLVWWLLQRLLWKKIKTHIVEICRGKKRPQRSNGSLVYNHKSAWGGICICSFKV